MDYAIEIMELSKDKSLKDHNHLVDLVAHFGKQRDKLRQELEQVKHELSQIKSILEEDTGIHVKIWQRDCDCVEWTSKERFTSLAALESYLQSLDKWADGPFSVTFISKKEYDSFLPEHRDYITEAFENGNGTSVVV